MEHATVFFLVLIFVCVLCFGVLSVCSPVPCKQDERKKRTPQQGSLHKGTTDAERQKHETSLAPLHSSSFTSSQGSSHASPHVMGFFHFFFVKLIRRPNCPRIYFFCQEHRRVGPESLFYTFRSHLSCACCTGAGDPTRSLCFQPEASVLVSLRSTAVVDGLVTSERLSSHCKHPQQQQLNSSIIKLLRRPVPRAGASNTRATGCGCLLVVGCWRQKIRRRKKNT